MLDETPDLTASPSDLLKLILPAQLKLFGGQPVSIRIPRSGFVTLLGPNGSGKSQVMRQLKDQLTSQLSAHGHVLMLAAGRLRPFESGRMIGNLNFDSKIEGQQDESITLHDVYRAKWHELETYQGVINRLAVRVDVGIKVAERLRALFGREIRLHWEKGELRVEFARGGSTYPSSREASGLLHLVGILAALYDDELTAVLIDEPGISLHPQYQAFVRREMERAAGEPKEGKKLVIWATHAPAMVRLRTPADLCSIVFFQDIDTLPIQVDPNEGALSGKKLGTFVRSLGASHREALFAVRPLLVEGPSDELVVEALDGALGVNLHASGGHVVQAVGKGTMPTILKLLRLTGKEPSVLADLDAFTDDLDLVKAFNDVEAGRQAAGTAASLYTAIKPAYEALCAAVDGHWQDIEQEAKEHRYWTKAPSDASEAKQKRRAAAAVLLSMEEARVGHLDNASAVWTPLRRQLTAALDMLEKAGLFIQRAGTVEDYYAHPANISDKVAEAANEADSILNNPIAAGQRHDVAVRALKHASPSLPVDESAAVRNAFVAVVGPVIAELRSNPSATTDQLQSAVRHASDVAHLFKIKRGDDNPQPSRRSLRPSVWVDLSASVLDVAGFPVVVYAEDDVVAVAEREIRSK